MNRSLLCLSIFKTGKSFSLFSSVLAIFWCPINPSLRSYSLCVSRCQWDICARRLMLHIHIRDITTHPNQTNQCIASGFLNSTPKNFPTSPYNTNKPITSGGNIRRLVADLSELRWRTSSPSSLYSSNNNLFSSNPLFSSLLKMLTLFLFRPQLRGHPRFRTLNCNPHTTLERKVELLTGGGTPPLQENRWIFNI